MNIEQLFKNFLSEIEQMVSTNVYYVWFLKLKPLSLDDNNFKILVPMNIVRLGLTTTYKDLIDNVLFNLTGKHYEMEYITQEEYEQENIVEIKKEEIITPIDETWETNLNKKLTFDTFVVGDSNKLAYISAKSVAEKPGEIHNPLLLYGKSGIGKTHLMMSIGNYIVEHSNKKVLYITSNDFVDDYSYIASFEKGQDSINYAKNFKNKYQNVDVLIIDDIQFLVEKYKSQQEFFHTFNALYQANKQIIISSDRSPDDLKKIEERLRSRFMWGLPVDIYPPDYALRCKIINKKIQNTSLENKLDDEIIDYIANSCENDVRHIEGTINRLLAYTAIMIPDKIDLKFANEALNDYVNKNIYSDKSISKIQKAVANYYDVTVNDLKSKKKTANIAKARHIAIYLSRIETDESLAKIGLEFGGRDHSTISASYDKIVSELKNNEQINNIVKEIKNQL